MYRVAHNNRNVGQGNIHVNYLYVGSYLLNL